SRHSYLYGYGGCGGVSRRRREPEPQEAHSDHVGIRTHRRSHLRWTVRTPSALTGRSISPISAHSSDERSSTRAGRVDGLRRVVYGRLAHFLRHRGPLRAGSKRLERHGHADPNGLAKRLDDPYVAEPFVEGRLGLLVRQDAVREIHELGRELIALREH